LELVNVLGKKYDQNINLHNNYEISYTKSLSDADHADDEYSFY